MIMKNIITVALLICISNILIAQETNNLNFPGDYFGVYTGTLNISSERGIQKIPMEFHLNTTDSIGKYKYVLVYGENEKRQERNYFLIEKDAEKGNYIIDEDNGILLNAKVLDNKLYCLFEVEQSLLTTFITFEKDQLLFEIVYSNTSKKGLSGSENDSIPLVTSYPLHVIQKATLLKQ